MMNSPIQSMAGPALTSASAVVKWCAACAANSHFRSTATNIGSGAGGSLPDPVAQANDGKSAELADWGGGGG